jgi:hypothetical protein
MNIEMNPSISRMLGSATGEIANWMKNGFHITGEELQQKRQNVCDSCEFYINRRCGKCGCFMAVKIRLQSSSCPEKKW